MVEGGRIDETNRLRHDPKARKVVKGVRRLLLRNKRNLREVKNRVRLREFLAASEQLATVYVLKDDLKHLWDFKYPAAARRFWEQWHERAVDSGIEPLVHNLFTLDRYSFPDLVHFIKHSSPLLSRPVIAA